MSSKARRKSVAPKKDQTCLKMERMEAQREERRRAMHERKQRREEENQRNIAAGNPGDVDFIGMVRRWREAHAKNQQPHDSHALQPRICICVRKRPISDKERAKKDHDSVTCLNPEVWIHSARLRVDGITKYLDNNSFQFDHAFGDDATTEDVYRHTTMPLIDFVTSGSGGRATVFAYGQTGSGKTYTMNGIQSMLCADMYLLMSDDEMEDVCTHENTDVMVSFFELYGGFVQDLLNERKRLKVLEDGNGEVIVTGLQELQAETPERFMEIVEAGNAERTTHTTEANDSSSRSHAICQITLREKASGKLRGKFSLVDLAGSERGSDTKSHNAKRRAESSDINTSLLSLKECIRALDMNAKSTKHVPYRGSKLTLILKDCFTSDKAMTAMIATVSPGASAAEHSLNTLRYADRIKEKRSSSTLSLKKSPIRPSSRGAPKVVSPRKNSSKLSNSNTKKSGLPKSALPKQPNAAKPSTDKSAGVSASSSGNGTAATVIAEEEATPQPPTSPAVVQELFEEEEAVLNMHMNFIAENAQLLSQEGSLLQDVQKQSVTASDIDRYATALEHILDRKEDMIVALQDKLAALQQRKVVGTS